MSSPELTAAPPSEQELLRRYAAGDVSAREELARSYMPLARRLAGRYRHTGEAQDDLEQVAYLGLLKAIDRYDAGRGPFVRYAVPNIMGELKRHFRDKGWGAARAPLGAGARAGGQQGLRHAGREAGPLAQPARPGRGRPA